MGKISARHAARICSAVASTLLAFSASATEEQVFYKGSPWDFVLSVPDEGDDEAPYCGMRSSTWAAKSITIEFTLTNLDTIDFAVRLRKDGWKLPVGKGTTVTVGSFPPGAQMTAKAIDSDHLYAQLPPAPANAMDGNAMNFAMTLKTIAAMRDALPLTVSFQGNEESWMVPAISSIEAYRLNDAYKSCKLALTQLGPGIYGSSKGSGSATSPFDQSSNSASSPNTESSAESAAASSAAQPSTNWEFSSSEEDWGKACYAGTNSGSVKIGLMASPGKELVGYVEGFFIGDTRATWQVSGKIPRVSDGGDDDYFGWHSFYNLGNDLLKEVAEGSELTISDTNGKRIAVGLQGAKQAISSFSKCIKP